MDRAKFLRRAFAVMYDETYMLMISFSIILMCLFTPLLAKIISISFPRGDFSDPIVPGVVAFAVMAGCMLLSIYQLFPNKKKSAFEKNLMLLLIVAINTGVGYFASFFEIENGVEKGFWIMLFPIINFFSSLSIFARALLGKLSLENIADRDSYYDELILGCAITALIFFFCRLALGLGIMMTFSVMLVYIMMFHRFIRLLFYSEKDFIDIDY